MAYRREHINLAVDEVTRASNALTARFVGGFVLRDFSKMAWQAKHLCHSRDFVYKGQVFQPAHQMVSHNDQQTTVVAAKIFRTDRPTRPPHRTVSVLGTFTENSRRFGKLSCQTIELIQDKLLCLCRRA
jgi:hypothetical protein